MAYSWEIETTEGGIRKQYEEDGKENTWKDLPLEKIIRLSFIPSIPLLPQHDVIINHEKGQRFIRRFGRGFLKQKINFNLAEYVNCCVTNHFRVYVLSSGRCLVTDPDYELYL